MESRWVSRGSPSCGNRDFHRMFTIGIFESYYIIKFDLRYIDIQKREACINLLIFSPMLMFT